MEIILKTLVGSRAHGTSNNDSDFDYRGVFVHPTSDILSISGPKNQTTWIEGKNDDTAYEIQRFLFLALKCNPSVLEMFGAPVLEATDEGREAIKLFPYVWNSKDVFNAFRGYGANQRKKYFEDKDKKANKFLAAWMRTLFQANYLFWSGDMLVDFSDTIIFDDLKEIRSGEFDRSEKLNKIFILERELEKSYEDMEPKFANEDKLNEFLLKVRKAH